MVQTQMLLGILPPFQNKKFLLANNQTTKDIIKQIIEAHKLYAKDYDKIAGYFWKGSVKATCKYLFEFLKHNVKYSIEPDTHQSVKSPAAILATGMFAHGKNDCKHYSLFQAGVLDALRRMGKKIDWSFRFANYKLLSTTPHHVFVVVTIDGVEFWCDPVLSKWNEKKPYINKIDKKMSLYTISGVGCYNKPCNCKDAFGQIELADMGRPSRAQRKAKRQARRAKRRGGEGCTGRTIPKFAPPAILARKAFLALVALNFKKFAVKLHKQLNSPNRAALLKKWCSLGGSAKTLENTVNGAYNKWKRKNPGAIGEPVSTATLITAATTIIAALAKFLGKQDVAELAEGVQEGVTQLTDGGTGTEETGGETTSGVGAINPYIIYGAIGLGAIYLLSKKRK
jgi:hypothetical protein